ncbi:MAG: phosphoribosyltransferase [Candidatus Anstonellaceae archaeon]
MKFLRLSWQNIEKLAKKLSKKIIKKNFKPDVLVGLSRGGLVPLRLLSDFLEVKKVAVIQVQLYKKIAQKSRKPKILQPLAISIKNKKILVVDDVCDSGTTLKFVKNYLKKRGANEIFFATLHLKPTADFIPDFYASTTSKWIIYPWEKEEIKKEKHTKT